MSASCRLCQHPDLTDYAEDKFRRYLQCTKCHLVFVPNAFHLPPDIEKQRYDLHENNVEDAGYRTFLNQLIEPLLPHLKSGDCGLDFGSGPFPAIATLMAEKGYPLESYDPIYQPDPHKLEARYDFVTCSEVVEHFYDPAKDWQQLFRMIKPGGILAVMTSFLPTQERFGGWRYKDDDTHVCFYAQDTLQWLAEHYGAEVTFYGRSVTLFKCSA